MAPLNILSFGASRNIGYFTAVRLLEQGATVTFLLRSPSVFDGDGTIQKFIKSGTARLVQGDAINENDTQRAWKEAGVVDAVVFTIGGVPKFNIFKGEIIKSHNLTTQCMLSVLCTMPTYADAPQPKFIALSSIGSTPAAYAALPLPLKVLYSVIPVLLKDKAGMERAVAHCAGWAWNPKTDSDPATDIMGTEWTHRRGLPVSGTLDHALVIRMGWLSDGPCVAEAGKGKKYRVSEEELSGYRI